MTLAEDAARVRDNFGDVDAAEFLSVISRVCGHLRTGETRQYLESKIQAAQSARPAERQALCKNLRPYLDWYLSND